MYPSAGMTGIDLRQGRYERDFAIINDARAPAPGMKLGDSSRLSADNLFTLPILNDPVTVPLRSPFTSISVTLVHVQGPDVCAVAVMANSRATEPTNRFVSVLIVAKEVSTPRCGGAVVVVEVIKKLSVIYCQRRIAQRVPIGLAGAAGLGASQQNGPEGAAVYSNVGASWPESRIFSAPL